MEQFSVTTYIYTSDYCLAKNSLVPVYMEQEEELSSLRKSLQKYWCTWKSFLYACTYFLVLFFFFCSF